LNYCLGVDGLSLPLVALTALTWIAISSNESVAASALLYFDIAGKCRGCGGFPGSKLLLFVLFYEVELIPIC